MPRKTDHAKKAMHHLKIAHDHMMQHHGMAHKEEKPVHHKKRGRPAKKHPKE